MKKLTVTTIGLFCGAALSTQAQFGLTDPNSLNINVYGSLITPTTSASVLQLENDPWWHNSSLAEQWAAGYAQSLFNWAKYNDPGAVEHLPNVYFAFNANGNWIDTWVFDEYTGKMYEEFGNPLSLLVGVDPPFGGVKSVPDSASTGGLIVLALVGMSRFGIRKRE